MGEPASHLVEADGTAGCPQSPNGSFGQDACLDLCFILTLKWDDLGEEANACVPSTMQGGTPPRPPPASTAAGIVGFGCRFALWFVVGGGFWTPEEEGPAGGGVLLALPCSDVASTKDWLLLLVQCKRQFHVRVSTGELPLPLLSLAMNLESPSRLCVIRPPPPGGCGLDDGGGRAGGGEDCGTESCLHLMLGDWDRVGLLLV